MQLYPNDPSDQQAQAQDAAPMCGMNTTPLIDVMLVLIVMLIITIPVQLNSVNLDMPSAISAPTPPSMVRLDIQPDGSVLLDGIAVPNRETLSALLLARSASAPPEVHVHPNSAAPYAAVAGVLALTQQLGLTKVGVVGH